MSWRPPASHGIFGSSAGGSFGGAGGTTGETAQLAHGLASSMQRALGGASSPGMASAPPAAAAGPSAERSSAFAPQTATHALGVPSRAPAPASPLSARASTAGLGLGLPDTPPRRSPSPARRLGDIHRPGLRADFAPGEVVEVSSPLPSRVPSTSAIPGVERLPSLRPTSAERDVGQSEDAERRRIEIASLRQEIATLLRMNSGLHARLSQANLQDYSSTAGSAVPLETSAASVDARSPLAWIEERRALEDRAARLTEECRTLEQEKASMEARAGAGFEPPSVVALMRERDDVRQRLHAAELARCAAEHRSSTADAALARSLEELQARRQRPLPGTSGAEGSGSLSSRFGPWLSEEIASLRRELAEEQARLDDADLAVARKKEQVMQQEREQAEVKLEYDALRDENEASRREIAAMKEKAETDRQGSRGAEAELGELQAQFQLKEFDLAQEVDELRNRAQAVEHELIGSKAELDASEAAAASSKVEGLELQSQIDVLRAAHDELQEQERRDVAEHEREASELEARAQALAAERLGLGRTLEEVEASKSDLQARDADCVRQCENASRQLVLEREKTAEICRRSQQEVATAEARIQALLQQLTEEREQNIALEREVCIAREAAGEIALAPWTQAEEKAAGKPKGWASTALQMHRELDLLSRWKSDAMSTLRRMQGDMDSAQRQYREQLHTNQGLQERLERMGQQARAAMAGASATGSTGLGPSAGLSVGAIPVSMTGPAPGLALGLAVGPAAGQAPAPTPGQTPGPGPAPAPLASAAAGIAELERPASTPQLQHRHKEMPAGMRDMGGWSAPVYTKEQQQRLNVDEFGAMRFGTFAADVGGSVGDGLRAESNPAADFWSSSHSGRHPGGLLTGPDVPERPDLPAQTRAADLNPRSRTSALREDGSDAGALRAHVAPRGAALAGPVSGPFYEAYRASQRHDVPTASSRAGARAEVAPSRRRAKRSSSGARSSSTPVAAALLSGGVGRPISAGGARRR